MKLNEDVANMFMNVVMFSASIVHFILEKLEDLVDWWDQLDKATFILIVVTSPLVIFLFSVIGYLFYTVICADLICNNKLQAMNASGFFDDKTRICYVEYEEGKFIDLDKFLVVR